MNLILKINQVICLPGVQVYLSRALSPLREAIAPQCNFGHFSKSPKSDDFLRGRGGIERHQFVTYTTQAIHLIFQLYNFWLPVTLLLLLLKSFVALYNDFSFVAP